MPGFAGCGDVHVVQAGAGPAHHLQPGGGGDELRRHFGGAADHQGVGVLDDFLQLLGFQARPVHHLDVGLGLQDRDPGFVKVVADEDLHTAASLLKISWAAFSPTPGATLYPN